MEEDTIERCHLLELPAELRLRIYEHTLCPTGTVKLTRTKAKRFATQPVLAPAILATCRQIYDEASSMLYKYNTISINIDAHDTTWPVIAEARLPQRVLEKLQRLSVTLDARSYFHNNYNDVDWKPFAAMTSLKMLRLALITTNSTSFGFRTVPDIVMELLPEILERIPADTKVLYGTEDGFEERHISGQAVEVRVSAAGWANSVTEREVDTKQLSELAGEVSKNVVQGCRSGGIDDVFAEYRTGYIL